MVGATKDSIVMVEGEMKEISEQEMLKLSISLMLKLKNRLKLRKD
jgi:polyribonucleotide nucleotidyltransferase